MEHKLGSVPSPPDSRDYSINRIARMEVTFPEEFRLRCAIKDQGNVGSCVAFSLANAREITELCQSGEFKKFSTGFIYGNREETDYQGEGMIPREALKNLVKYGTVQYKEFPYNIEMSEAKKVFDADKERLIPLAQPYKISAYARVRSEVEIKTALTKLGPVLIGIDVYSSFYRVGINGIVPVPVPAKEQYYGGHAMIIIGWTKNNQWIVANSWGPNWGDKGYCYIPFNFSIGEAWSITDAILPEIEVPEPQPTPEPEPTPEPQVNSLHKLVLFISRGIVTVTKAIETLKKSGFEDAYYETFDKQFIVVAGSYQTKEEALEAAKELPRGKQFEEYTTVQF